MENEKLFEFMEKMYSTLTERLEKIESKQDEGFKTVNNRLENVEGRLTNVETKIEMVDDKLQQLSEIQDNQCQTNDRHHAEIVEMLTERLDTQDKAIRNITIAK